MQNVRPVANARQVPGSRLDWLSYGDELGKAVLRTNVVRCNMLPTACSANAQPQPLATGSSGPEERAGFRAHLNQLWAPLRRGACDIDSEGAD